MINMSKTPRRACVLTSERILNTIQMNLFEGFFYHFNGQFKIPNPGWGCNTAAEHVTGSLRHWVLQHRGDNHTQIKSYPNKIIPRESIRGRRNGRYIFP